MGTIVWEHGDGKISVTYTNDGILNLFDYGEQLQRRGSIPVDSEIVLAIHDKIQLPRHSDKFFNALVWSGNNLKIDIKKAREIKKTELRFKRMVLFKDLDSQYIQALEKNSGAGDIVSNKQKLRDFPISIDLINTLDELIEFDIN